MGGHREILEIDNADVDEGQEVALMTTSSTDLVELVEAATDAPDVGQFCEALQGALAFYCAGCSLQIRGQIGEVAKNLSTSLQGQPFMGILPYGEQGTDGAGSVHHGNLMYSLLLFGKSKQRLSVGSVRVRDARGRQW